MTKKKKLLAQNILKSNYQEKDARKENFNPEQLEYTDISINDVNYSIKKDDEILSKIRELIRYGFSAEAISNAYDYLTK